jgi:hypothetical protein
MTFPCWLFENLDCSRKVSTSAVFHLASGKGNRCCKIVKIHGKGPIGRGFPIGHYQERRLRIDSHKLMYEGWHQVGTSRNNLAHTLYLFRKFWGFDNSLFWKCNTFQIWRDAYACAAWCLWCMLEWLGYPYALMIGNAISSREGDSCVTSCYLTT